MANTITMTAVLKAIADFSDVKTNVGQLKNAFSQLKLPSDLKEQFSNIFSGLEKDVSKASEMMSKGFKTTGDVSKFETVVDKISKGFRDLQAAASEVSPDMVLDSFTNTPELEKAISKLKELTKAWEDLRTSGSNDATKKIEDSLKSLHDVSKNKSIEKFKEAFETLDFSKMEEAFKELQKGGDYFAEGSKNGQIYKDTVEELGKAFEQIKASPELKDLGRQLQEVNGDVTKLSEEGRNNLLRAYEQLVGKLPQLTNEVDQFGKTAKGTAQDSQQLSSSLQSFANKAKYFLGLENAVRLFKRAVREAFETVKELDAVMTETAVVTEFDVGDMWKQLPEYTARAKELGVGLKDTYESATIFYQQGLNTAQVNQLSTETLKMARIAGLDAAEATDRMTNALRGFNMELNQTNAQRVSDVYSKLAAITASDTDEISSAMTKVASLANSANMQFETTAAFLSQIIETTREKAETAGTALKTVIARFGEVKKLYSEGELTGVDAEGEAIDVNKVSAALRTAGIDLNEFIVGAKGLDDIFLELASKWDSLTLVQQRYIATMAAGSRQQSRFIALMSNYDRTLELVEAANNANGASNQQYGKTLESLQSKLNNLKTSWETFLMGIANNEAIKAAIDLLTKLLDTINKITGSGHSAWQSISKIGIAIAALDLGKIGISSLIGKIAKTAGGTKGKLLTTILGEDAGAGFFESLTMKVNKFTDFLRGTINKDWVAAMKNGFTSMLESAKGFGLYFKDMLSTLGTAIRSVFSTLAAHPVVAAIVAVAAAIGLIVAIDKKIAKEQLENVQEAKEAYDEEKQKIEEINSELDEYSQKLLETKDRVAELNALKTDGKITATQDAELRRLELQVTLYEKQIDLLEKKKKAEQINAQAKGGEAYKTKYLDNNLKGLMSDDEELKTYYKTLKKEGYFKAKSLGDLIDTTLTRLSFTNSELSSGAYSDEEEIYLKEKAERYESFLAEYIPQMYEEATQLTYQSGSNLTEAQKSINAAIEDAHVKGAKYYAVTGDFEKAYSMIIDAPHLNQNRGIKKYLNDLIEDFDNTEEGATNLADVLKEVYDSEKNNNLNNFINSLKNADLMVDDSIESFKKLANQLLQNEDLFNLNSDAISNWNNHLNAARTERENFEEKIKNTETGTENFASFSESYQKYMELTEAGYKLGHKQVAEYAERLIGKDKMLELGDIDSITKYIKDNLGSVFSNIESDGAGLLSKLKEKATKVEEGYKAIINEAGEEIARVYDDGHWSIDTENHLDDVAKAFGMTTEEVIVCLQAIETWQTIVHETTTDAVDFLRKQGAVSPIQGPNGEERIYRAQATIEWTKEGKTTAEQILLMQQLEDEGIIFIDVELTGNITDDMDTLLNEGILSDVTVDEDPFSTEKIGYKTDNLNALTAAYASAKVDINDFFKTFDQKEYVLKKNNDTMYSTKEILDSLLQSYSGGKIELKNFYGEIKDANGNPIPILKIKDFKQTLIDAGFSSENIEKFVNDLKSEGNFIDFEVRLNPSNVEDPDALKKNLESLGLGYYDGDTFIIDVEATAKLGVVQGNSAEEVEGWINSINTLTDVELSVDPGNVESTINEVYTTPLEEASATAQQVADDLNNITTEVAQKAMADLNSAMKPVLERAQEIRRTMTTPMNVTVTYSKVNKPGSQEEEIVVGKAKGKHANDNYEGPAITGEEGPELRIGDGYAEILGANGPQFTHVDKDDIIYTADETKKVLSNEKFKKGIYPGFKVSKKGEETPPPQFTGGLTGGNINGSRTNSNPANNRTTITTSTSDSASSATSKAKEAWDKFYKDLKHQREMDEITDAQYYAALEANYQNYLDQSEENLDTWNSVVEEIYKGNYSTLTKAWNDELSEWDHKIAMEQATEADKLEWMKNSNEKYLSDNAQQHKDYEKALEDIYKAEVDKQKNAFNEGKEGLEHALAMDLISEEEYYKQVDELAKNTLVGNQKEIIKERQKHDEDMHKHEIKTQQDAWSKRQADLQYELEMGKTTQEQYWKDYEASYKEILVSSADEVVDERLDAERELQKGIRDLEKQTFEERLSNWERLYNTGNVKQKEYLAGLTRTLNTEYIQWRSLSEDEKKEKEQALFDVSAGYEDMASNNASALEKMHDLVVKQIQSEKKAEMEAIDVKIKDLKTVADARKQAIDDIEKENDYLKEQRGLQKTAAQLEAELEMMKSDTSAAGMAKRRKLEAQLAEQKEKIADSEHKHSIEAQKDQIDKQTQMQTEALEAQKKAIEDYTNNEAKVSEDAWIKMNVAAQSEANMSKFFDDLTNWAKKAGLDIQDEISTTVAGFETAMDESQNNFVNSMAAYEEAGLGPREMLQSLADSGVDVSKVLTEMDEMGMDNEWSDDVKGLLATRLQAKGVTNEQVASAAQVSADDINLNEGMGQKTALDMAAQMEGVGLGWEEAQEALNKYMAAQGRDVQLSAKSWRDLALQLTDNNVSMADLSGAMHTYGKDTEEWLAATSKVDDSVNAALILKAKYGEVQTSINSMKSAYGAYEMDMLASGQKVIPAVDSFTTRTTQIVENGALTIDQKLEALQTETEERWDNSTFGQITAEQQATIDANLQKLKDDYGLSDTQIQAGWDAVKNGVMTPEELAEASTKLLELGGKYSLSNQQIQDGWKAVTSGQLSTEQLANVDTSLDALKGKYDLSNQTIGGLWNQVTAGTLTPEQLENARLSCVDLEGKFSTSKDTINGIWGQIANGHLNATDFTTLEGKLGDLEKDTGTKKDSVNTLLGQVASGAIDGEHLPAITGIVAGLDKIYNDGLADANNTNALFDAIATGEIDPKKLTAINDIVGLLGTIPSTASGAKDLVNEALSSMAKGEDVDISALKEKTKEMQGELMDVTSAANNADIAMKSMGEGKQTITADTADALKARAAMRAAAKLDTYTDAELGYLDVDGDGKVTSADARIWLRRSAKLESYASGTSSVPSSGTYRIDEGMQDELIYDPSQNALLSYLNKKSIVFPADVSRTMKQLFFNPDLLSPSFSAPSAPSMEASINNTTCGDIHMGDIVINGNTDQKTIAQIRAEQKRQAKYIGDIFERDQRFMTNI